MAGDLVYSKGQKDPYNIYCLFAGACEAIDPISDELVWVFVEGMIFGLEGWIDWEGNPHAAGDVGYPHTVVAQPHEIPGRDRYS